jgi:Hsp90 protein
VDWPGTSSLQSLTLGGGVQEPEKVAPVMKTEQETTTGFEQQNKNSPIWVRSPKDVDDEEYNNFFTTTFREFVPPMARSHFNVEGTYEFSGLLFVPGMAPFDAFQKMENEKKSSIRLFVKRVFISDQFDEQLLPRYLSFIKGIVDSSDLPLNVSREILQVRAGGPATSCAGRRVCACAHVRHRLISHPSRLLHLDGQAHCTRCTAAAHLPAAPTPGWPAQSCDQCDLAFAGVARRARHPQAARQARARHDCGPRGEGRGGV